MYYKYRGNSKYTDMIFSTGKVHLSTAKALNDPFECSLEAIGSDWKREKILDMKQAGIAGFAIQLRQCIGENSPFFGIHPGGLSQILDTLSQQTNITSAYAYYKSVMLQANGNPPSDPEALFANLDDQLNKVGIFSLSSSCSVQLLWAHYAEEHKGICIGFAPEAGRKLCNPEHFLKVAYADEIPKMSDHGFKVQMTMSVDEAGRPYTSAFKIAFSDQTFQSAISTKPLCWAYEEEWRYVEPLGGDCEWPGRISEIVFGLNCPLEKREHYIDLATRNVPNEVYLYEMVKQAGGNQVVRLPYSIAKTTPLISPASSEATDLEGNTIKQLSAEQFAHEVMRLIEIKDFNEAFAQIDSNLCDTPGNPHLLNLKAMALGMSGDHPGALAVFDTLDTMFPDQPDLLYQKSCALSRLDRHAEAIELLKKANALDHSDPSIPFNLGVEIIKSGGNIDDAKSMLNTARLMGHPRAHLVIKAISEQAGAA